jgi:hypothetical protein
MNGSEWSKGVTRAPSAHYLRLDAAVVIGVRSVSRDESIRKAWGLESVDISFLPRI